MSSQKIAVVIPARMGSTRFPGKPLADLAGKPMIQWVVEAARRAELADEVVVATPDQAIIDACNQFGCRAVPTRADHPSGTDRIAEVAERFPADIYINVQGDEPLTSPETIRACAQPLIDSPEIEMSSVYTICPEEEIENPAAVKVVTDLNGFALYFSRYPIPYPRNPRQGSVLKHVGIYGYRPPVLKRFSAWPMSPLEGTESLEQLRFLENGTRIRMSPGPASELAVDTPEQAEQVSKILLERR